MNLTFKKIVLPVFVFVAFVLLHACKPTPIDKPEAYLKYMADKNNGLVKEKTVAGITYRVKYVPAEYLVYNLVKEATGISKNKKDSILKAYDNSVTFILNISPAENETVDIMKMGINNYAEFADRVEQMAFSAQDWMSIQSGDVCIKPVITRLENINTLETSRNFIVVFNSEKNTDKDLRKKDMCFTYTDQLFDTGINKFIFKAGDINMLPEFKF